MIVPPIDEMYWSSDNADEFFDKLETFNKENAELAEPLAHFGLGFVNGVYGDIAIPIILAGASGALGTRIRHNIWWACNMILDAFHTEELKAIVKLGAVYAINNKAKIAGKITGTASFGFYKRLGIRFRRGPSLLKMVANPVSLAIIAFIHHKALILKINQAERLLVFLYVMITGDNNLLGLKEANQVQAIRNRLAQEINETPFTELNTEYQLLEDSISQTKQYLKYLKQV